MALTKSIVLPNKISGSYLPIRAWRIDEATREASFQLHLYADRETALAAPAMPLYAGIAKVRINGADFDTYFGPGADNDHKRQAYRAIKAKPELVAHAFRSQGIVATADAQDVLETGQTP